MLTFSLFAAGCSDVELNLGSQAPQRPILAPPEPIQMRGTASAPESQPADAEAPVLPAYYQLVITTDPIPACETCGVRFVRVRCASAQLLAQTLGRLYVSAGVTGSGGRYTLVYPTAAESSAATVHIETLDVAATRDDLAGLPTGRFACAIGSLYAIALKTPDRAQVSAVVAQLESCATAGAPRWQDWAAKMLVADILADRSGDFDRAAQASADAAAAAEPGSLEQLEALYAQARLLVHAGKPTQARRPLETIIGQFANLRETEAHDRARQLLTSIDRKR